MPTVISHSAKTRRSRDITLIKEEKIMPYPGEKVDKNSGHEATYDSEQSALAYIELSELEAETTEIKGFPLYSKGDRIAKF